MGSTYTVVSYDNVYNNYLLKKKCSNKCDLIKLSARTLQVVWALQLLELKVSSNFFIAKFFNSFQS